MHCLQKTHFEYMDMSRLKVTGRKKIYHANINQKEAGVAIVISHLKKKRNFREKKMTRDRDM